MHKHFEFLCYIHLNGSNEIVDCICFFKAFRLSSAATGHVQVHEKQTNRKHKDSSLYKCIMCMCLCHDRSMLIPLIK